MPRGPGLQSYFHFCHKVFSSQLAMLICIKGPSLSVMLGCAQGCVCAVVIMRRSNWNAKTVDKLKIAYNMVDFIRRGSW